MEQIIYEELIEHRYKEIESRLDDYLFGEKLDFDNYKQMIVAAYHLGHDDGLKSLVTPPEWYKRK